MKELPTRYQQFVHLSRYARWIEEEGRRETWEETVGRYVDYMCDVQCEGKIPKEVKKEVRDGILNLETMPSMRCMMTAGEALGRDNVAGYNCSYLAIDDPKAFDELLYVLMCGTGVGFSVERQFVNQMPVVAERLRPSKTVIGVEDSKIGWANAYRELISMLYQGRIPGWDTSEVRKAGARLKTFGGRASGPEPLEDLFRFTIGIFRQVEGRRLNSIECHDLCCKIGEIVVVGGVRRSALISLSNPSDDRMRHAKSGNWYDITPWRMLANNSACYTERPETDVFMREWLALYESKSGERGIFNREAVKKWASKFERRDPNHEFGTNPCCFTGDMELLTKDGYKTFEELCNNPVEIVNNTGEVTRGEVWCSGEKEVIELIFEKSEFDNIVCTPDHLFMLSDGSISEAKDLLRKRLMPFVEMKDDYDPTEMLAGFIQGDSNLTRLESADHLGVEVYFGQKDADVADVFGQGVGTWYSREAADVAEEFGLDQGKLPERKLPEKTTPDFLTGLFTANGSVIRGHRVALKTTCRALADTLSVKLKDMFDIESYVTTNSPKRIRFSNGEYECRESYDVNISQYGSLLRFASNISFVQRYKRESLYDLLIKRAPYIRGVKNVGIAKIYDFTEPETHWGVVNGCVVHNSEIVLRSCGLCNLSEVVIRADDDIESLKRKVRLAVIMGTMQASLTSFRYLRDVWRENAEEEALLGVSLTGIMDNELTSGKKGKKELVAALNELRDYAVEVNKEWAGILGINQATAVTCVKPSGTVSQLVDCSSGIHPRHSEYYVRRVRADKKDPLATLMYMQGFPCEPSVEKPDTTVVFSFPVKSPESALTEDDVTSLEHLELWKTYQVHWCEHKPSITVKLRDSEWIEAGAWVFRNFDIVSGISFLPYSGHVYQQAPYEEFEQEAYEELLAKMPEADWRALMDYEKEDQTIGMKNFACGADGTGCDDSDLPAPMEIPDEEEGE